MSHCGVVADCDAMNFVLIHHRLTEPVRALLMACDWHFVTLDKVYRSEAQSALRGELDRLKADGRCDYVDHPDKRDLDKKQRRLWKQIDDLAHKRFGVVSQNDRGLLFEAQERGILLVSGDGPLRNLADERGQLVLDVLDVIEMVHAFGHIPLSQRDDLLGKEAKRQQKRVEDLRLELTRRGRSAWPCRVVQASPPDVPAASASSGGPPPP